MLRAARPNSHVQIAVVGVGGRGYADLHSTGSHPKVRYVGCCDIDQRTFAKAGRLEWDAANLRFTNRPAAQVGLRSISAKKKAQAGVPAPRLG